jgi:putative tryptophan/tyrosine transport system substrate-binding protein
MRLLSPKSAKAPILSFETARLLDFRMKILRIAAAAVVALGLVLIPRITEAEQKVYKIGFLWGLPPTAELTTAFDRGLADLGWIEGKNIVVEHRSADGHFDRLPGLCAELVAHGADLIVALSAPETLAARKTTSSIPIVFVVHGDPVYTGDVQSLAYPGGNITGLSQMHPELSAKQLSLLRQVAPHVHRVAVVSNAGVAVKYGDWEHLTSAARTLDIALQSFPVYNPGDFESAFAAIRKQRPDGMLTLGDPLTVMMRRELANFALKEHLPAVFTHRQFVEAGGLISYGANFPDLFRRAAGYVDKILKGEDPSGIPVQQPVKFELFVNLKTANALGLTISPSIMAEADQIIE